VEKVQAFAEKHDIEFPLTQGTTRPDGGGGLPHMVVFDVEGNCVFSGHPASDECEDAIKDALKAVKGEEDSGSSSGLVSRVDLVPERSWTNTDGNKLVASLVSVDGDSGTFRKSNGQTFPYAISKLSDADQKIIQEATAAVAK